MITKHIMIKNIPALLWGSNSEKVFIAIHGNMSSKSDIPIAVLAEASIKLGYQVLSFDLPEHVVWEHILVCLPIKANN